MRRVGHLLRLSFAVALVSGLGLAATSANAQFVDETSVCADPNSVFDNFDALPIGASAADVLAAARRAVSE